MLRLMVVFLLAANLLLIGLQLASEPPPPPPPPAAVEPFPADVPRLRLLSEVTPAAFPEVTSAPAARQCFTAGPFETVPAMISAREALGPLAEDIEERESEALVELGYWVSLPPSAGLAEAGETLQVLDRAGLRDMAVVTDDAGEHRVSLGYFLEEANARARRDEVRALGFEAETRLQRESQRRFWMDYAFSDAAAAERAAAALPAGRQRPVPCPDPSGP